MNVDALYTSYINYFCLHRGSLHSSFTVTMSYKPSLARRALIKDYAKLYQLKLH